MYICYTFRLAQFLSTIFFLIALGGPGPQLHLQLGHRAGQDSWAPHRGVHSGPSGTVCALCNTDRTYLCASGHVTRPDLMIKSVWSDDRRPSSRSSGLVGVHCPGLEPGPGGKSFLSDLSCSIIILDYRLLKLQSSIFKSAFALEV